MQSYRDLNISKITVLLLSKFIDILSHFVYTVYTQGGDIMTVKLREVGNSITITIPKEIVSRLGLQQGMEADVISVDQKIIVEPRVVKTKVTLKSLFANYSGTYKPHEINWGESRGNEVW